MTAQQLSEILAKHQEWLLNPSTGARANLSRANLSGANLYAISVNPKVVRQLNGLRWPVLITPTHTTIGCQRHPNENWLMWTPAGVAHMHPDAEEFWREYGPAIKVLIETMKKEDGHTP